jgi:hypothetical protein
MRKSNYNIHGRYGYGGGVVDYGDRLGWWERLNIPKTDTDITVKLTSKYSKRPDLLAYDVYGQSTLQWLVLQYNNILDVNEEFTEGAVLTLPTKVRVMTAILNSKQQPLSKY